MSAKSDSRVLFVGPAGCGKSERLLKLFEERLAAENPLEPQSYFIVPSREHAERVIKRLIIRGSSGFFSNRVTTLDDLIEQSFEIPNPPAASNLTKIAVVRRLLSEDSGIYFEKIRDKPGFLDLVLNFLSELKDFCWTKEAFRTEMNRLKKLEPDAAMKYEALAGIYERYDASLVELGLRDRRDTLNLFRARKKTEAVKPLHFHTLCLDGFFDFTPLQMECVQELASAADYFYGALTWDAAHQAVFEPVTATKRMFEGAGFQLQPLSDALPRFISPDLAHLSRSLFLTDIQPKKFEVGVDSFEAPDAEIEAEMIARRALSWMSEKSCRPSDIAVLLRSVRPSRAIFESVFRRFGIPVEIHERERLSESEWIQTAVRLVRIFREGWKKEDWLGFLKSSFVSRIHAQTKDERVLHAIEIELKKRGVRIGLESWEKAFPCEGKKSDEETFRDWIDFFIKAENQWRAARTLSAWTKNFRQLLFRDFGMLEYLASSELSVQVQGGAGEVWGNEAAAPARFEKILEEMERAAERGSDAESSFDQFADDFLRLVELDLFSLPQLNQNAVQIYDVSLARQKEYEVVFVAGLAEKQFPLQVREDALLSDWERRLIQKNPYGLPERKSRQHLEKYLFYLAVTRARRHLGLSFSRRDEEGKPVLPSFYFEELAACFEGGIPRMRKKDTQPYPLFSEVLTASDLRHAGVGALFNPWENPGLAEADLEALLRQVFSDAWVRSDLRKALTGDEAKLADERILKKDVFCPAAPSPTRLEAYAKCAYRYFSEKILKLQETEADTRARDQGNVMHNVMQHFFEKPWRHLDKNQREAWLEKELKQELSRAPLELSPYQVALSETEIKTILLRFIESEVERLERTPFQPAYCEYEISRDNPVMLEVEGEKIKVQGRIDRIDVNAAEKTVVISDYKRAHAFSKKEMEAGLALQLPLYLLAVQKLLGLKPVGGQLLHMKEGKASGFFTEAGQAAKRYTVSDQEFQEVLARALRFSRRYLDELAQGRIQVQPRDCVKGCGYASLCRIEKWRLPELQEQIRKEDKKRGF